MTGPEGPAGGSRGDRHLGRFTALLVAMVVLLLLPPLLPGVFWGRQVVTLFFTVVAFGAAFDVGRGRAALTLISIMAVTSLAAYGATLLWPGSRAGLVVSLLVALGLYGMALAGVAREVFRADSVSLGTLRGAVCVYLLIGIFWATLYAVVETVHPGSFSFPDPAGAGAAVEASRGAVAGFFYYSFVILTTLGYGDIAPRTELARTLSWFEALVGQLFIALTLARLVAVHVSQSLRDER